MNGDFNLEASNWILATFTNHMHMWSKFILTNLSKGKLAKRKGVALLIFTCYSKR